MNWKNVYRGFVMGSADVVPGVSGGTIAVLLGIYDQLIAAINGLFSKDWKKHVAFLVPLGIGIVLAIFTLANVLDWLLIHYPEHTYFTFLGLIIGVLPLLFHEAEARTYFKMNHIAILIVVAILVGLLSLLNDSEGAVIVERSLSIYLLLFFSGFLGSAAMVLPGISGSFILLVIGVFSTVISAVRNFEFDVIIVTGAGIALGIIVMSRVIDYFLVNFRIGTYAVIIGMVIGSIFVIFPGWPTSFLPGIVSIGTFAFGLAIAYILGKVEYET